jgi:cell division septation protein DedD
MARNEDGEFEMTLGNRQLLSIFFLVIILLAVFFTMGYLMGRGTGAIGPTLAKNGAPDVSGAVKPETTGSEVAGNPPAPQTGEQQPPDLAPGQAVSVLSTTPATTPAPPAQETGAKPVETKPAEPPAATAPQDTTGGPQPGRTYLQVAATTAPEGELEVDVLKKRGFSALLAPVPNGNAYRVLVGPMKDAAEIAKTKLDLEELGFKQVIIRKY